jgi:hypothetical protein
MPKVRAWSWPKVKTQQIQNLAIVVRDENLSFRVICQKIAMFEQLNEQLLVKNEDCPCLSQSFLGLQRAIKASKQEILQGSNSCIRVEKLIYKIL